MNCPGDGSVTLSDNVETGSGNHNNGRVIPTTRGNDDDTSSSGISSGEEEDSESESGEDAPGQDVLSPPVIRANLNNDLKSRLSAFLPQMEKANKELEDAGDALNNRVDDVADGEGHYIEMNLGLGVLSREQDGDDIRFRDTSGEESSSESDGDEETSKRGTKYLNDQKSKVHGRPKVEEL